MKKFLAIVLIALGFGLFAETYTVVKVVGRAKTIDGAISPGQELDGEQLVSVRGYNDYIQLDNNLYIYGPVENKKVKDAVEERKPSESKK